MNTITFECDEEIYSLIPRDIREFIDIKVIEPKDYDYSSNEEWQQLNKESYKAFKKLKKKEFEIIQKKK